MSMQGNVVKSRKFWTLCQGIQAALVGNYGIRSLSVLCICKESSRFYCISINFEDRKHVYKAHEFSRILLNKLTNEAIVQSSHIFT